eukprot:scaffold23292_cov31-Tisochrysis_lutea.AAC.3
MYSLEADGQVWGSMGNPWARTQYAGVVEIVIKRVANDRAKHVDHPTHAPTEDWSIQDIGLVGHACSSDGEQTTTPTKEAHRAILLPRITTPSPPPLRPTSFLT